MKLDGRLAYGSAGSGDPGAHGRRVFRRFSGDGGGSSRPCRERSAGAGIPPPDLAVRPLSWIGSAAPFAAPLANEPAAPAFSFLREARPLFGGRETSAEPGIAAPPSIPFQAAAPKLAAEAGGPPTPAVPSGLGAAESAFPAFSFLEEARPLVSYPPSAPGPVPVSGPADARPEFAGLNLAPQAFDVETIRRDFPILRERVNGRPLVWLDNAATTQKPQSVIDRLSYFYAHENSNVHRAAHELAARATDAYESAREKVRRFLNAPAPRDIVFVRGATEGINMVAQSWDARISARMTKSSSRGSNITPTSCPGRCSARKRKRGFGWLGG